jgi:predicted O-methyltransferase YrrM
MGVNIIPNRYEEPVPDLAELRDFKWDQETGLTGVDLRPGNQLKTLNQVSKYFAEFKKLPVEKVLPQDAEEYFHHNPAFRATDAGIYYGLIRYFKPRRIIEIGAGFSTLLAAQAVLANGEDGEKCDLTAIEPYPSVTLRQGVPGLKRLIEGNLQTVPLKEFEKLEKNDILFIDSSHILKIDSDVFYEFLEIIPRLKKGVLIHVHDIYFPLDYPRKLILEDFKFYNEQYLLQAFLAFNKEFETFWVSQYMYQRQFELIQKHFSDFLPGGKTRQNAEKNVSFWMRRQ